MASEWARPRAPPFIDPPGYVRHRPEATLLYHIVERHYPAFVIAREAARHRALCVRRTGAPAWGIQFDGRADSGDDLARRYAVATLRPGTPVGVFYVHTDHLNTPRKVTRPSDNKARWTWESDPFGTALPNENPQSLGAFAYNLRFPGQIYDALTALNYNYFRDYDTVTGRYIQSDPIGLDGGLNTYLYAKATPLAHFDPYGLDTTITVARDTYTTNSITGTISVSSDRIADTFSGYHLENRSPPNPQLPVPAGSYDAFVDQRAGRKDRIELFNVPNATDVQIHIGNVPNDSLGCFLPGTTRAADFVGISARAMDAILDIVKRDGGKIKVIVSGGSSP